MPLVTGDRVRAYNQIKVFSSKYEIYLFSVVDELPTQEDFDAIRPLCYQVQIFVLTKLRRFISLGMSIWNRMPLQTAYFYSPLINADIQKSIQEIKPDLIFTQLIRMAPYSISISSVAHLDIMDSAILNDLPSRKLSKVFDLIIGEWQRNKETRYVEYLIPRYQRSYIISKRDKKSYSTALQNKMTILPNGVDCDYFKPIQEYINNDFDIGFCGNMNYEPNKLAALYIVSNILGHLAPDNRCLIGGISAEILNISKHPALTLLPQIDDIRKYYQSIRVFVAPIFSGSGMQNKVLEAMAQGIPVICTSFVNEAIGATDGQELFLADSPAVFIARINDILKNVNLADQLSKNARKFVMQKYNWVEVCKLH